MYYSKSAALQEHVDTLAAVLSKYKSKNMSDLDYTRKISCMVTDAYRLRRRNDLKPFVPATVSEWMHLYLNGPSVQKHYRKESKQIYVPKKINHNYREAITILTMVLETFMGSATITNFFSDMKDPVQKNTTKTSNPQLFDLLTHQKLSDKLNLNEACSIPDFSELKDYKKVFVAVGNKVKALQYNGKTVSLENKKSDDAGTDRTDNIDFKDASGANTLEVKYTPLFDLDLANECIVIEFEKNGTELINLHPLLISGADADTYYVMNSALYKDDQDKLHTLQMAYLEKENKLAYLQDGKNFIANEDLDKLKIVEGYFLYDKNKGLIDQMIIDDQTASKTLDFLLLGNTNVTANNVENLSNFGTDINAEKIKDYAGMANASDAITLKSTRAATEPMTSAGRGMGYINRLMRDISSGKTAFTVAVLKERNATELYYKYMTIAMTLAFVISEHGIRNYAGLTEYSTIPRLVISAITMGGLMATKAYYSSLNEKYAEALLMQKPN